MTTDPLFSGPENTHTEKEIITVPINDTSGKHERGEHVKSNLELCSAHGNKSVSVTVVVVTPGANLSSHKEKPVFISNWVS